MNFKEAYEQMLKGKKVRRPGWKGYWWIEDDKVFAKNNSWDAPQKRFSQVDIAHTAADDWEVVEKSKVWKPKEKELYFYYDSEGLIYESISSGGSIDKNRLEFGNCFKTRKEAEHMVEKFKVINELKNFALENNEEEIDWNNLSQRKYVIIYDPEDQNVDVYCYWRTQYLPFNIHFTSEKIAQKAIETIGEDRIKKYYFDVED